MCVRGRSDRLLLLLSSAANSQMANVRSPFERPGFPSAFVSPPCNRVELKQHVLKTTFARTERGKAELQSSGAAKRERICFWRAFFFSSVAARRRLSMLRSSFAPPPASARRRASHASTPGSTRARRSPLPRERRNRESERQQPCTYLGKAVLNFFEIEVSRSESVREAKNQPLLNFLLFLSSLPPPRNAFELLHTQRNRTQSSSQIPFPSAPPRPQPAPREPRRGGPEDAPRPKHRAREPL